MKAVKAAAHWLRGNVDLAVALSLALVVGVLGTVGTASQEVVSNAVLATLAVIAFTLVVERGAREALRRQVTASATGLGRSLDHAHSELQRLQRAVEQVDQSVAMLDSLIKPTPSRFLARDFQLAMVDTDRWVYKGGTGTFLRAVTLKANARHALQDKKRRLITIEILDPTNAEVCDRYGRLRRALAPGPDRFGEVWTTKRVRNESYATILAAAYYVQHSGLLDLQFGLSSTVSIFRYDLSSSYIIITQEDGTAPALKAISGTFFYDSYANELRLSLEQSRRLDLQRAAAMTIDAARPETISEGEVRKLFEILAVPLDAEFSADDIRSITQKAFLAENPYA
ncbi:MAG TPA: hypothetical protein VFA45_24155 [Actinomycetes bacterium]|jgi:hypothetical protein|nr:hypothetical protein [Actinomycetes bacterium]